jgi:hypothetical protein
MSVQMIQEKTDKALQIKSLSKVVLQYKKYWRPRVNK